MKYKSKLMIFITLFVLFALPTSTVFAQGPGPGSGRVVFGSNITVESGDVFDGDLVVFGGNVKIEEGAEFNGDIVVIGGNIQTSGEQDGDVVVVGGQIEMEDEALITGDVVIVGGQIDRAETATIEGELINNVAPVIDIPNGNIPPVVPNVPSPPAAPNPPNIPGVINVGFNPISEFGKAFAASLLMAVFAMLVTLFFQKRLDYVANAIISQPMMAVGIGFLSFIVAFAFFLTVIPLIALGFAWLFGAIAIGQELGDRLGQAMKQEWTPTLNAGIGTFMLVFILGSIDAMSSFSFLVGCFTWVLPVFVGLLAVGGVVVTRFGSRPVQGPGAGTITPPAGSETPAPASES